MQFKSNGILSTVTNTSESVPTTETSDTVGGIYFVAYAPYGGAFLALCHSGLCYGITAINSINTGAIFIERIEDCKIKFLDNVVGINEIYLSPEPVLSLNLIGN